MNDDTDMPEEEDRVIKIEIDNFRHIQFHLLLGWREVCMLWEGHLLWSLVLLDAILVHYKYIWDQPLYKAGESY